MTQNPYDTTVLAARLHHQVNTSDDFLFKDVLGHIAGQQAKIFLMECVIEAARRLEYEIDQTYDVDDGDPNYPFGKEWEELKCALTVYDKETKP